MLPLWVNRPSRSSTFPWTCFQVPISRSRFMTRAFLASITREGLLTSPQDATKQRNDEQDHEDPEQQPCAFHGNACNTTKPDRSRDQRNDEKYDGVMKQIPRHHFLLLQFGAPSLLLRSPLLLAQIGRASCRESV